MAYLCQFGLPRLAARHVPASYFFILSYFVMPSLSSARHLLHTSCNPSVERVCLRSSKQGGIAMAKIKKVGHVVLGVRDPQRSIKFYTEVLGMELVNVLEEMQMAFLSFGERDHDIAVIKVPEDQPVGSSGLAHTALEIEGGQEQLRELYQRLKSYGAKVEFTADHVLTKSVYFFDPDGNRLEIFSQELPAADAKQFLHDARAAADVMQPLDLETATR
jgi:catechol 2,3-dioxygenase